MYITRELLKVGSWEAITDMINASFNYQLEPGSVGLKAMTKLGPTLTQIEIIPNRSTNPINALPKITETVFRYDRLNCQDFFRNTVAVNISGLPLPISTFDILKRIGDKNEIVFEIDDFLHQTFDAYSAPGDPDLIIEASANSLRFVGHLKVRLVNTLRFNLSGFTGKYAFPELGYEPQAGKINADHYLSRFDFTPSRVILKDAPVGYWHHADLLAVALAKQTLANFSYRAEPAPLSLVNKIIDGQILCKILYNGACVPLWTSRTDMDRVCVVELSDDFCTGITGWLRLHYN